GTRLFLSLFFSCSTIRPFSLSCVPSYLALHSFPTRRSSDLDSWGFLSFFDYWCIRSFFNVVIVVTKINFAAVFTDIDDTIGQSVQKVTVMGYEEEIGRAHV